MNALLYLALCRLKNSLRRMIKTPRLLLPGTGLFVILGAQLAFYFQSGERGAAGDFALVSPTELIEGGPGALVAAVKGILVLSAFTAFINALGEGGLFFTQSDVDFLFPAPLTRRAVLFVKMLGRYTGLLFPAVYLPLVAGSTTLTAAGNVPPLAYWPGMLGCWLFLMATANAAQTVLLSRATEEGSEVEEARQRRRDLWRRSLVVLALVLAVGAGYLLLRGMRSGGEGGGVDIRAFLRAINSGTGRWLLLPVTAAAELFYIPFHGWSVGDTIRLLSLAAFTGGSFYLLFSRDRDFYENALGLTGRRTRMANAVQSGDAGAILSQMAQDGKLARGRTLPSFGSGARAVLWRDLVATTRTPVKSWVTLLILAAIPALLGGVIQGRGTELGLILWLVLFTLQMSGLFLLPLRDMLRRADISKALPISPARFLLAELTLSITQLTLLGWFSLSAMAIFGLTRGALALTVMIVVLPSLAALLLLVQTSFILLYPSPTDPAQNAVSGMLSVVASLLSLLPGVMAGMLLFAWGRSPVILGAGVFLVNLVSAGAALCFAAFLWQRFDPTD